MEILEHLFGDIKQQRKNKLIKPIEKYFKLRFFLDGLSDCLKQTDPNGDLYGSWVMPINESKFHRKFCNRNFVCKRGREAISDHAKAPVHAKNRLAFLEKSQTRLTSSSSSSTSSAIENQQNKMQVFFKDDEILAKELRFTIHVVNKNRSARSGESDMRFLKFLAPVDCKDIVLSDAKIGRLINNVLGPYSLKHLLNDFKFKYFSVNYDETENQAHSKDLQITIRYFSKILEGVNEFQLETKFIETVTADVLASKLLETLKAHKLSLANLMMLGSDGPNFNLKVNRIINSAVVLERVYGLLDLGTCPIHILHLLFKNSISFSESLDKKKKMDCSDLSYFLVQYFKKPSAQEKFRQYVLGPPLKFIAHNEVRWCTLLAVNLILEKWTEVCSFFEEINKKPPQKHSTKRQLFRYSTNQTLKHNLFSFKNLLHQLGKCLNFLKKEIYWYTMCFQYFGKWLKSCS